MALNYRIVCFLGMVCLFAVGTKAGSLDSLRTEKLGDEWFIIHKVEQSETLYSLARRYGVELPKIQAANDLNGTNIDLGQELRIPSTAPVSSPQESDSHPNPSSFRTHTVSPGETLYSIGRIYGVEVPDIKKWNSLSGTDISIGQELRIGGGSDKASSEIKSTETQAQVQNTEKKPKKKEPETEIPDGFNIYYVQTGDLLETIAAKYKVRPDSIVIWNKLPNSYLTIGQKLLIRGEVDRETMNKRKNIEKLGYGTRRKITDPSGLVKIIEEGSARKIEDVVETQKYLALHRSLPIGTMIEVRNLMNNQKIFVRVVGKLPETGLNKNVLVRLTPICFDRLGVIDPMTRVELTYFED